MQYTTLPLLQRYGTYITLLLTSNHRLNIIICYNINVNFSCDCTEISRHQLYYTRLAKSEALIQASLTYYFSTADTINACNVGMIKFINNDLSLYRLAKFVTLDIKYCISRITKLSTAIRYKFNFFFLLKEKFLQLLINQLYLLELCLEINI